MKSKKLGLAILISAAFAFTACEDVASAAADAITEPQVQNSDASGTDTAAPDNAATPTEDSQAAPATDTSAPVTEMAPTTDAPATEMAPTTDAPATTPDAGTTPATTPDAALLLFSFIK